MSFTRKDLKYKDYSWTVYKDDDPKVIGPPDSTLFHRKEGYEVEYLIKKFMKKHNLKKKSSGHKVEKMLRNLPGNIRSQKKVMEWLEENWSKY